MKKNKFKPLKPNLWAPLTEEEKRRAETLTPLAKAIIKELQRQKDEGPRL